ncbi:MAG: DUF423 domain-containing protein [Methylococcales bacterium]|nr:DUF423 domain-containing protein [Methylococcales bacterium]
MQLNFLFLSALCGLTGVAMGAFGAHGLKAVLSPEMLAVYKTAVDYQMWHALGLGLIALLYQQTPDSVHLKWAGQLMFAGILLFSGSLYLLAILNIKWLGMITPLGGIAFLIAWGLVAFFAYHSNNKT